MNAELFRDIKIKKLPNSLVEIEGEIPFSEIAGFRSEALKTVSERLTIDGFRKGHIPEQVVVSRVGEITILEEAAELALRKIYPELLEHFKIDAVGRPEVSITKLADKNPLGFKIKTAVIPEITLPDYKKISREEMGKKDEPITVENKEVDDVVTEILSRRKPETESLDQPATTAILTDEIAKSLGDFKDAEEFKTKLGENIHKEKEARAIDKKRVALAERMIHEAGIIELPDVIVSNELQKMFAQLKGDLANAGLVYEDYLKHIKKTEDDLKKDWRKAAEEKGKMQLILNAIADKEKIIVAEDEIKHEVEHLMSHYKDADPLSARIYIETVFQPESISKQFLETKKFSIFWKTLDLKQLKSTDNFY
ncbi:hypothetical protein KW783_03610 [Candidatus Parcubacteria bacterium]|nr:hypothetical protein [Candidatus Parcubacteria bacterium]